MDDVRRSKFEKLLSETKDDIQRIEVQIERELAQIKERLAGLQNERKAQLLIYGGYCQLLGVENDMAGEEDDDDE